MPLPVFLPLKTPADDQGENLPLTKNKLTARKRNRSCHKKRWNSGDANSKTTGGAPHTGIPCLRKEKEGTRPGLDREKSGGLKEKTCGGSLGAEFPTFHLDDESDVRPTGTVEKKQSSPLKKKRPKEGGGEKRPFFSETQ